MQAASLPPQPTAKAAAAAPSTTPVAPCKSYTDAYAQNMVKYHQRFYIVLYLFSLLFAFVFQTSFNYHTIPNAFSWKTLIFSFVLFITGSLISVFRQVTFTVWKPAYPSYLAESLAVWTSLDNLLLLGLHSVASLFIIRTYFSYMMGETSTTQFLLPAGYYTGARQLNQQNIFICVYAIMLGINYTYEYLSKRKFVVKINNVQQPFFFELKTSLATLLCNSAKRALWTFLWTYTTFILRKRTFYLYVAQFFGLYTRVLDSPIIGFHFADLHLFLRLIVCGILTSCIFFITNRLFEINYSYTLPHTDAYANQFDLLVDGLSDKKKERIQIAAFSELAIISAKRPEKRKQLFDKIGRELHDSAWYKIMTQCCNVIQDFRNLIDIEYNGVKPVAAPAPVAKPVEQKIQNRLQFSNGEVFTTARKNQIYYDDRTLSIFQEASELANDAIVPQDITTKVQSIAVKQFNQLPQYQMIKMLKNLELRFGCDGLLQHYYAETLERRVQLVFNQYQLLVWAVQSLGSLTAASLHEDPYGYVQNDIGNVLNSLLGCLVDVEKYSQAPPAAYSKLLKEYDGVGEIRAVTLALKEAIYQIRDAFNDYAQGFPINDQYKSKWMRFLEFKE